MIIKSFATGPLDTNVYLIGCEKTKEAVIIDPSFDSLATIIHLVNSLGLKPTKVLLTHSHFDHIADAKVVVDHFQIPLFVHHLDKGNMIDPGSDGLPLMFPIEKVEPADFLEEGKPVTIGQLTSQVIHTPGHTPGGICLYFPKEGILISGDTLFKGSIGNISLPTAEPDKMWSSLEKLATLPSKTRVYPGHGPETTIGEEKWLKNPKEFFS